jgi:5'-3' exonuclease
MKKYLLVDVSNCFMRARHVSMRADTWTKLGLALHITLGGIKKMWEQFTPDHVVFCAEGRSWRKDFTSTYKQNRSDAKKALTPTEKEELDAFYEMMDDFIQYVSTKTNATMLQNPICEADDLIAGWIQSHPNDLNIIISTDTDFVQLLNENVQQYNPVKEILFTVNGVFDKNGNIAQAKNVDIEIPNPEYELFYKCIRGDSGDNVFPAYPGAREKGSKNKIGIIDAFNDRIVKGFNWNSFMNIRWMHHDGSERIVKDEYARNVILVDLTKQPQHVKDQMNITISNAQAKVKVPMVGIHFLKFTQKYDLATIQEYPKVFVEFLAAGYN